MGLFLSVVIVKNADEEAVKSCLVKAGNAHPDWNLITGECQYRPWVGGVKVLLNDMCAGYEAIPQELSKELLCPSMLCYIYDGDYWGYYFYEKGKELDAFHPMPDYFEPVSEEERQRLSGNSAVLARYFSIDEGRIKRYLVPWDADILESGECPKAYENDVCGVGEDWQMADFMSALGCPYDW